MKIAGTGVVITGGASGIGRAVAQAMAERGGRVAIFDLNEAAGHEVARDLGGGALFERIDRQAGEALADDVARRAAQHLAVKALRIVTVEDRGIHLPIRDRRSNLASIFCANAPEVHVATQPRVTKAAGRRAMPVRIAIPAMSNRFLAISPLQERRRADSAVDSGKLCLRTRELPGRHQKSG